MARLPIDQASLYSVVEQLGRSPVGVDPMLGKVLQYAVAYHHAGKQEYLLQLQYPSILEDRV